MYVLDTNACTRLLNNTSPALVQRLCRCDPSHIHLSSVVKAELLYGARHSARVSENLQLLERFSAPSPLCSLTTRAPSITASFVRTSLPEVR